MQGMEADGDNSTNNSNVLIPPLDEINICFENGAIYYRLFVEMQNPVIFGKTLMPPIILQCTRFVLGSLWRERIGYANGIDKRGELSVKCATVVIIHDDVKSQTIMMLQGFPRPRRVQYCLGK